MQIVPMPSNLARFRRIESAIGQPVVCGRPVHGGYTPAQRWVVTLSDGSTLFAKIAVNELTAGWLRQEKVVYDSLTGPFMPHLLGWDDDGEHPILLLEDLSNAFWPPPWNRASVEQVLETLALVSGSSLPDLPALRDHAALSDGWERVAADPEPFLSLGLADEHWLDAALPTLLAIDGAAAMDGADLLHLDIRSDNLCFDGERVVIIDWNNACIGNGRFDIAAWLPSLEIEGGPPPQSLLPDAGEIAALISGYFASMAGLPPIPDAPRVRQAQLAQLISALPWAIRELNLPPLHEKMWSKP